MATLYTIPLIVGAQTFAITLGNISYTFEVTYADAEEGGYVLGIRDASNNLLVDGIPFVTGVNLLAPYKYLNIGGGDISLYIATNGDFTATPTYENLGTAAKLYARSAS